MVGRGVVRAGSVCMARRPRKAVADAELEVLHLLWEHGEATVRGLLERFPEGARAYTTVQTLVTRLEQKGYVTSRKDGRALVYSARVARDEVLASELDEVASRVTGGKATPLMLNLVENNRLSKDDIAQLRAMLDRLDASE